MKVSVVIPTFNRFETLKKCLDRFAAQDMAIVNFEVIVVDDGSTDPLYTQLPSLLKQYVFQHQWVKLENGGPARARNQGILKASGEVVIVMGDDILVSSVFVRRHYEFHVQHHFEKVIGIGEVEWDPDMEVTPFMAVLDSGIQFSFKEMKDKELNYKHCYTANVSFVREHVVLSHILFCEEYKKAAYEDIEWGYRLQKNGFHFKLCEGVMAHHHHKVTLQGYAERMIEVGKAYVQTCMIHPEYGNIRNKNRVRFLTSALKNEYRFFILKRPRLYGIFKKIGLAGSEEKWIKGVLGYYQDLGIRKKISEANLY